MDYEDSGKYLQEDRYDNGYDRGFNPLSILKGVGFTLAILMGPTVLVSVLVFVIFLRQLMWKPRVTIFPLTFIVILLLIFSNWGLSGLGNPFVGNFSDNILSMILSYLYLSLILGLIGGFILILYKTFELKRFPEYVHIKGWAENFEYAPTPLDNMRKKRNIQSLKDGGEFDYERAPMGVIDEPVVNPDLEGTLDVKNANKASIVYRYYEEAMAHTLITGKTGSGKALHVDTEIRVKRKGWVTIGDVEVGDTIYDELGNHTLVEEIYQPMTEDHYELTFDNGEVVKACGDHLWNIGNVNENNTLSTRELAEHFSYRDNFTIEHSIDDKPIKHTILRIREIEDYAEDYLCFTVDSPSHLFLITRSFIPTHNTVTMLSLIQNDILAGNPLCVIDFKKSPDLIYFLSKWAKENNREFFHFVSGKPGTYRNPYKDDQATYDPLSTGGATAKADMILNLRSWDSASEVFKKRTQDVLQSLFFLLERTPRSEAPNIDWDSGGLAQFVSALDLDNFKRMIELMAMDMQAGKLSQGDVRRYNTLVDLYKELSAKTKTDLKAQIVELLSIARTLIVSNYGDWLATGASGYHIDLMSIATDTKAPIVLFSFNQQEEPEFAQYIGSIVMSDLSRVSALKNAKGDSTPFGVYIDEFQTLDPATVKDNLEKARSSKMYITLSLQSIEQIVSASESNGEAMANAILDTCANFIFHDGSGYDTAEKMSKIIGKTQRYSRRTTSQTNNRLFKYRLMSVDKAMVSKEIEEDWLVPPSKFQSLSSPGPSNGYKATAYVINKSPEDNRFQRGGGALARKIHVVVAEETAKGVSNEFKKQIFIPRTNELEFDEIQATVLNEYDTLDPDDGDWGIEDIEEVEEVEVIEETIKLVGGFNHLSMPILPSLNKDKVEEGILDKKPESQLDMFKKLNAQKYDKKQKNKDSNKEKKTEFSLPKLD